MEPGQQAVGRSGDHFPCFNGLRALAALAIVVTHVANYSGAGANVFGQFFKRLDAGIAVFFVLSGFLLYRPFVRAHLRERPRPATGPFLWRRALRIYPAYWVVLTFIVYFFNGTSYSSPREFFLDYSLLNTYFPSTGYSPLLPAWTLSVEISFYVLVPIWASLVALNPSTSLTHRVRRELLGIATLVATSVAWKALVLGVGISDISIYQLRLWLPWWLDLFAIGMLFAIGSVMVRDFRWSPPLRLDRPWTPAVCWLLAASSFVIVVKGIGLGDVITAIPPHLLWGQHYLYGLVAGLLVLPAVFGPQTRESSWIRRFLTTRVMVYLGVVSYGIYLWHVPMIERYIAWTGQYTFSVYNGDVPFAWRTSRYFSIPFLVCLVAVLALTIAAASISWFSVERPALKLKRLGQPHHPTVVTDSE